MPMSRTVRSHENLIILKHCSSEVSGLSFRVIGLLGSLKTPMPGIRRHYKQKFSNVNWISEQNNKNCFDLFFDDFKIYLDERYNLTSGADFNVVVRYVFPYCTEKQVAETTNETERVSRTVMGHTVAIAALSFLLLMMITLRRAKILTRISKQRKKSQGGMIDQRRRVPKTEDL